MDLVDETCADRLRGKLGTTDAQVPSRRCFHLPKCLRIERAHDARPRGRECL